MFDSIFHVTDNIRHSFDIKPGVFEPVDSGLGQVERVVGVGDGVQGDDETEAVPGGAGDHDTLTDTRQLQSHSLLHGGHVQTILSVKFNNI